MKTMTERDVRFVDGTYRDVLIKARDLVHQGHRLLSHP
ncbi:MAG: GrdX protein, partial [Firmicutes bacterium]|nr:GrdX protein [Bacillota bacterium]